MIFSRHLKSSSRKDARIFKELVYGFDSQRNWRILPMTFQDMVWGKRKELEQAVDNQGAKLALNLADNGI